MMLYTRRGHPKTTIHNSNKNPAIAMIIACTDWKLTAVKLETRVYLLSIATNRNRQPEATSSQLAMRFFDWTSQSHSWPASSNACVRFEISTCTYLSYPENEQWRKQTNTDTSTTTQASWYSGSACSTRCSVYEQSHGEVVSRRYVGLQTV